jgi:hypothetical protein
VHCAPTDSTCIADKQAAFPEPEAKAYDHHEGQISGDKVDRKYILYVEIGGR